MIYFVALQTEYIQLKWYPNETGCRNIKYFYNFLNFSMRATCPTHLILLDFTILIISDEEFELFNFSSRTSLEPTVSSLVARNLVLKHPLSTCMFFL
jgi:hypothetical protein